ncbi:hypothetical protein TNCV_1410551 [Trichonephila clavipes]|nr:hypothetical protein TNCV_1410551 [Trichonephila clavipes]
MRDNMEEMDTTSQSVAVINATPPVNNVMETTPQNGEEPVSNEETKTEKMEVEEESDKKAELNKTALMAVLQFLKKHNLQIESKFLFNVIPVFCFWTFCGLYYGQIFSGLMKKLSVCWQYFESQEHAFQMDQS